MSQLTGATQIAGQELYSSSATPGTNLGALATTGDGRFFRYAKFVALAVVGRLYQAAAEITDNQNVTVATAAIGANELTVTLGATAATADAFRGAYIVITAGTGAGNSYKILGNTAAAGAATCRLFLEDVVRVATAVADSKGDIVANPYNNVLINPATASSAPVGFAVHPVAAGEYGWLCVSGPTPALADGTVVVGTGLVASNATAGAVEALTGVQAPVATALTGIATTQLGMVNAQIN